MTWSTKRVIAGPIIASTAFVMELALVPLLLPVIQDDHSLTIRQLAWFFNSYSFAVAVGVLAGGWIGDVFGAKRVFSAGVLMFTIGALIVASSQSLGTMLGGRILQGLGGGIFSPLIPVLLTRALPVQPGRILVIWGSITGYFAAFAPLAVGPTVSIFGWQSIFVLFAALSGVALVLSGKKGTGRRKARKEPLPSLMSIFAATKLWMVFGYIFCTYGAIILYLFQLPLRLTDLGLGPADIGVVLAVLWLSFSIVGTLLRNWVDGPHLQKIVYAAPLLIAAGFAVGWLSSGWSVTILSAVLLGAGFASGNAPSTLLVLKFAPDGLKAFSTSLDITFARLGGVATVGLLSLLSASHSLLVVLFLSATALMLSLLFSEKPELVTSKQ